MICPYEPGRPIESVRRELGLKRIVKLASNENPLGPSPRVVAALNRADLRLHLYPDHEGLSLRAAIARHDGVPESSLMLGAGSSDLMRMIAEAYLDRGDEGVVPDLCFPLYETVVRLAGARPVVAPVDAELRIDLQRTLDAVNRRTRVVFLATPNNPTALGLPTADLVRFLEELPQRVLCVLDLAYGDYREEVHDPSRLVERFPNLVLLKTFSKVFALAGLRIGYAVAAEAVIRWMDRARIPFGTSSASHLAAKVALGDSAHVARSVELNRRARSELASGLERLGLKVQPSQANFVLADLGRSAEPVFQELLRRGVIVRPMRHSRISTCLRITTGTLAQQKMMLGALDEVLARA